MSQTSVGQAMKAAGVQQKSLNERVWLHLQYTPSQTSRDIASRLKETRQRVSNVLHDLEGRLMVTSTNPPPGEMKRYRIAAHMHGVYELLPMSEQAKARKGKYERVGGRLVPKVALLQPTNPVKPGDVVEGQGVIVGVDTANQTATVILGATGMPDAKVHPLVQTPAGVKIGIAPPAAPAAAPQAPGFDPAQFVEGLTFGQARSLFDYLKNQFKG
jgi:hypothetical protein